MSSVLLKEKLCPNVWVVYISIKLICAVGHSPQHLCESEARTNTKTLKHKILWSQRKRKCWLIANAATSHGVTDVEVFDEKWAPSLPCTMHVPAGHSAALCAARAQWLERTIKTRWPLSFSTCHRPLCAVSLSHIIHTLLFPSTLPVFHLYHTLNGNCFTSHMLYNEFSLNVNFLGFKNNYCHSGHMQTCCHWCLWLTCGSGLILLWQTGICRMGVVPWVSSRICCVQHMHTVCNAN